LIEDKCPEVIGTFGEYEKIKPVERPEITQISTMRFKVAKTMQGFTSMCLGHGLIPGPNVSLGIFMVPRSPILT
jgi:hypothetical protein